MAGGIIKLLRVFNQVARLEAERGTRRGGCAFYIEPSHPEILDFLLLRRNFGEEARRARDVYTALWVPDLFMRRVRDDEMWSLIDPDLGRGLDDCWGRKYERLYEKYEQEGVAVVERMKARDLWTAIVTSQVSR